ncbi:protein of unknown function [Candidatus Nitrospira inopinata]|uniref:Uncharacterized protein n=1 Tax=Candidatus Nitrospira inopinata TaxID=1715989 RepID=A0A0S4KQE1_9BACT|nr:protein of unknown function [Candidatus Nitrospira inopinata]
MIKNVFYLRATTLTLYCSFPQSTSSIVNSHCI